MTAKTKIKKCRYCKRVLEPIRDRVIANFVRFTSAKRDVRSDNEPGHDHFTVSLSQAMFCKDCGHVAYTRKIHLRMIYDGIKLISWAVDA